MEILAVANQKGGVGKSTLVVHLAYKALEQGKRVLLVDLDKQGNLGLTFESTGNQGLLSSELFSNPDSPTLPEVISDKLSIIRADSGLLTIDKAENSIIRNPRAALSKFSDSFDICLIDTPPLLGVRLMAALTACNSVLTPVNIGLYELSGVNDLMETITVIKKRGFNPRLRHIGILPMKTNSRSSTEKKILDAMRITYGNAILPFQLPENAAVKKAVSNRKPVWASVRGNGHKTAAHDWQLACTKILNTLINK